MAHNFLSHLSLPEYCEGTARPQAVPAALLRASEQIEDLEQLMESLGAMKDEEPGFTSWTLDCGPGRQAPSSKPQAASNKLSR